MALTEPTKDALVIFLLTVIVAIVVLFGGGCSLQRPQSLKMTAMDPAACAKLDSKQLGWNVSAIVFSGLSGASGIASIAVSDKPTVVTVMGGVAIGVTIFSGVSTFLAQTYTQRFVRACVP